MIVQSHLILGLVDFGWPQPHKPSFGLENLHFGMPAS